MSKRLAKAEAAAKRIMVRAIKAAASDLHIEAWLNTTKCQRRSKASNLGYRIVLLEDALASIDKLKDVHDV